MISFFVPEIFKFSYYANLVTDDVIGCVRTVVRHKIKNISANNEATLLKLGSDVAPCNRTRWYTFYVAMATARFQSLSFKNQILPCVAARGKLYNKC